MAMHRYGMALLVVANGLAGATSWQPRAQAATMEVVARPDCNLLLHGRIAAGDAAALAKLPHGSICLDSEGGDLDEALKIIDLMSVDGPRVATVIGPHEACRAECALVFLAGRATEYHSVTFPNRSLHVAGILEFRSPGLAPSESTASGAIVAATYSESVASVSKILKREHEHGDPTGFDPIDRNRTFPLSLLLQILGAEPGHAFQLDTIDQAGRWGVQLDALPPIEATDAMLLQACKNQSRWGGWLTGDAGEIKSEDLAMTSPDLLTVSLRGLAAGDPVTCRASRYQDADRTTTIKVAFTRKGEPDDVPDAAAEAKEKREGHGSSLLETPLWSGLPPETRLDSLRAK